MVVGPAGIVMAGTSFKTSYFRLSGSVGVMSGSSSSSVSNPGSGGAKSSSFERDCICHVT
eukprot:scaffold2538_cov235-Pinguiococcus_pyrenoidosus.AAC.4